MTQILVTLEPDADTSFMERVFKNMKGVFKTSIQDGQPPLETSSNEWLEKLHQLKKDINPEVIDMNDDRTRYIMSK